MGPLGDPAALFFGDISRLTLQRHSETFEMSEPVSTQNRDGIAVLTIDSPPVNALGIAVRQGLFENVHNAAANGDVRAIVITGAGRLFCAGADIREFGKPMISPDLNEVIDSIEASDKPVIVAINGMALGGGLELSMACHYRVASLGAQCGQPEVKLGLIPGAGGTQRLPRLAGVAAALDMIVGGLPIDAARAHELGIFDRIIDGDLVDGAIAFANEVAGDPPRRTRDRDEKLADGRDHPEIFVDYRKKMARRARGYRAPYACVEAVEFSLTLPFDEGMKKEREIFIECMSSDESKSMRHVFAAERRVADVPGVDKKTPQIDIATTAVLGGGTMGGGIAMNLANAGIPVRLVEVDEAALGRGLDIIRGNYASTVLKGRLAQSQMDERMALITGVVGQGALADADLVIEAVFEEIDLKKEVFGMLDKVCKPGAILATNTSTLDVNAIAAATSRPDHVVGMHFFSPANVMRLVEIVRGDKTSPEVLATAMAVAKRINKIGVVVGVCDGFVGNRMLHCYLREAHFLVEEGASPQQVDKVMFDFGLPMGPFAMGDLAGLDVGWRIRKGNAATRPNDLRYSTLADKVCERGRFGQKTGGGFYDYEAGNRTPIPSKEIDDLILETSKELNIERRDISDQEILERCFYPLINEGAKILEEGMALRPGDIDIIWLNGYGFPPFRGGPMFYADTVGLDKILAAVRGYEAAHGDVWAPSPLLVRLAGEGKGFADFDGS